MTRDVWRSWGLVLALALAFIALFAATLASDAQAWSLFVGIPQFKPGSELYKELMRRASAIAGTPAEWVDSPGLEQIVKIESADGHVGIPNYEFEKLYGAGYTSPKNAWRWSAEWQKWRKGDFPAAGSVPGFSSRASGLGQLQPANMLKYYPRGYQSIGVPVEEAVGLLRYIADRYGDPEAAWSHHVAHGTY